MGAIKQINQDCIDKYDMMAEKVRDARALVVATLDMDGKYSIIWGGSNTGDHHLLALGILRMVLECHE